MTDERVCALVEGRGYCGRRAKQSTEIWDRVTCVDCHAAHRADQAVAG